jgi:hypothetical protein
MFGPCPGFDAFPNLFFGLPGALGELERPPDILKGILARFLDDQVAFEGIPIDNLPGRQAELPHDAHGDGYLPLGCDSGLRKAHVVIPFHYKVNPLH